MATYVPNADDLTQPTEEKSVLSAAAEFRTLKAKVESNQDRIDTLEGSALQIAGSEYLADADINLGGNKIVNSANAVAPTDVPPLAQVQNIVQAAGSGIIASLKEEQIATAGQTLFVIAGFTYLPGANNLAVYVNGLRQDDGVAYTETSSSSITFTEGLELGDVVEFVSNESVDSDAVAILRSDLSAPTGAAMVGFVQSGTGAVARTTQSKLRDVVSVKDFGAVGDGVTDDTAAIQAAITAAKGARLFFSRGRYYTTSTITIPHCMVIEGAGSALNDGDGTSASTILYGGTGPALQFGGTGYAIFYPNLYNLRIQATGSATSDANAGGLMLVNVHGGKFYDLAVRSFSSGYGVTATATAGQIGAGNTFWGPQLWNNKLGFKFDGAGAGSPFAADYASYIFGGAVIGVDGGDGKGIAGSVGMWVTQWAAETQVYGTDFETFDVCVDLYGDHPNTGGGVKLIGTRTEFQRTMAIRVNANTIRTQIIGHRFAGGASSTWLSDSGIQTIRLDPDGAVRTKSAELELLNDIPVKVQDPGGTGRTVLKMATNNTVQIGSASYSGFNGNFGLGTWNFTTPNITTPVFVNAGGSSGWQNPVRFGAYRLWVDSAGKLRISSIAPASDTNGTVVGTQT